MIRWAFQHQVGAAATHTSPGFRNYPLAHGVVWSYLRNNITPVSRDTYIFARRVDSQHDLDPHDTIWPGDTLVLRRHCTAPRRYINMPPYHVEKLPLKLPVVRIEDPKTKPSAAPTPAPKSKPRRSARIAAQEKKTRSKAGK